jgi:hypothetical protein
VSRPVGESGARSGRSEARRENSVSACEKQQSTAVEGCEAAQESHARGYEKHGSSARENFL